MCFVEFLTKKRNFGNVEPKGWLRPKCLSLWQALCESKFDELSVGWGKLFSEMSYCEKPFEAESFGELSF